MDDGEHLARLGSPALRLALPRALARTALALAAVSILAVCIAVCIAVAAIVAAAAAAHERVHLQPSLALQLLNERAHRSIVHLAAHARTRLHADERLVRHVVRHDRF